jgi:signal transduction histidine kinase
VAGVDRILLLNFTEFTELEQHKLSLLNQLLLPKSQGFNADDENAGVATDVFSQQLSLVNNFQHQLSMTHSLFEESIEGVSAGILVSDLTGKVLFHNKALNELTQASIQDTKTLFEVISLINDDWLEVLRDAVLYQKSITTEARSKERDLSVSIHCIQNKVDSSQSLLAPLLVFNITDISAVKQAHRSRSEMIDFLSHDLRSPMASLQALVNQARSSDLSFAEANDLIEKVDLYSRRGLTFAEQFLELAKVEGKQAIDLYEVDLYSVSQNALDTLYHQAQEKSIKLVMKADDDCWIMANGEMLERVILNLVSNAIKYGLVETQVLLTITRQQDTSFVVRITDQGPGIPEELTDNLFQPYSRGSDSHTQKAQGIGLGLRFVDVALKRLGSEIQFDSSRKGASFYFKFPSIEL